MIKITFPDGNIREYNEGITALEIAQSISRRLAEEVLAASVNGETVDLNCAINEDVSIKLYKWDDVEGRNAFWHSSSHLMAEAIEALYPGVKFGIGPAIENGFYYDVDLGDERKLTDAALPKIEQKMVELARRKEKFNRRDLSKNEALDFFTKKGDEYKIELINDLVDGTISVYEQGNFTDLCRGPHLPDSAQIKAIKLLSIAGAYWRGDENRKQLTRVYGITFPKQKLLDDYLKFLEEAKLRDHRKLGRELELFMFSQNVGQGLPMWLPKGAKLRERLENFLKNV